MQSLLKYLWDKKYYTLWILLSTALLLMPQYIQLDAFVESLFYPEAPPKVEMLHQPDLIDSSKGSFLIRNPVSESNHSFREWSIELECQPDGCSADSITLYDHTNRLLSVTRNSLITSRNDTTAIHPGTFVRADYTLSHGEIEDIIFSTDGFGMSLKLLEERKTALKNKSMLIRIMLCLLPILFLLTLLYHKNRQIGFLRIGLHNAWKEIRELRAQIDGMHTSG